jgi:hypothetical protein
MRRGSSQTVDGRIAKEKAKLQEGPAHQGGRTQGGRLHPNARCSRCLDAAHAFNDPVICRE